MEYNIEGMGCTGCANTIQKKLSEVAGVTAVTVDFATKKATVETDREIPFEALEKALEGTHYSIHQSSNSEGSGVFYCPMHCEGDKTYDHPGDCPVCGMDLVEQVSTEAPEGEKCGRAKAQKVTPSLLGCCSLYAPYLYHRNERNVAQQSAV